MSQRPANYPKYNERGRRQWRRYCVVCGEELFYEYRPRNPHCPDCTTKPDYDPDNERVGRTPWVVMLCPDEEYPLGGKFSCTEIKSMKTYGCFVPGMVLQHGEEMHRAVNSYKLEEVR